MTSARRQSTGSAVQGPHVRAQFDTSSCRDAAHLPSRWIIPTPSGNEAAILFAALLGSEALSYARPLQGDPAQLSYGRSGMRASRSMSGSAALLSAQHRPVVGRLARCLRIECRRLQDEDVSRKIWDPSLPSPLEQAFVSILGLSDTTKRLDGNDCGSMTWDGPPLSLKKEEASNYTAPRSAIAG